MINIKNTKIYIDNEKCTVCMLNENKQVCIIYKFYYIIYQGSSNLFKQVSYIKMFKSVLIDI